MNIEKIRQINPCIIKKDGKIQTFKEQLFDLEHGRYDLSNPMVVTQTSEYLSFLGNSDGDKPVTIRPAKVIEIVEGSDHDITFADLSDLEDFLCESGLAFDSLTHETSRVIVINRQDGLGNQIIAAIRLDAEDSFVSVNRVSSFFGKDNFTSFVERTYERNKTFYCNEKTEAFVTSEWLLLPNGVMSALSIVEYSGTFNKNQVENLLNADYNNEMLPEHVTDYPEDEEPEQEDIKENKED